jgi:polyphosphate kinase 2 (PPK2 family)
VTGGKPAAIPALHRTITAVFCKGHHEQRNRIIDALRVPPSLRDGGVWVVREMSMLETLDLSKRLSKEEYRAQLAPLQTELHALQIQARDQHVPIVIVYEGWDAAGKGGNIRRLTERLDPRFFTVFAISKPTPEELAHHYLWRFWIKLPERGELVIFDRSWYGRVLVERIEGFATIAEWQRAYDEINQFEQLLHDDGALLLKFWLHISPDEQLHRFTARMTDPTKRWKMTDEDWRNREKWVQYEAAVEDMLARTSSPIPWTLIEANDKRWARISVLRMVVARLRDRLAVQSTAAAGIAAQ